MKMKIHAFPHSPRAFKVLAAANHLGVDYEFSFCNLLQGAQKTPGFAAINPNQKMPVLEDGDLKLWESNAIILHLAARKPDAGLMPADERARADVLRWMFWESTTWDPPMATLAFERLVKSFFGLGAPDPAEVEKALERFAFAAGILDAHLENKTYVCGDRLSLADFALGADLILEEQAQLPLASYPHIKRWGALLADLPAWRAALAIQGAPAAAA